MLNSQLESLMCLEERGGEWKHERRINRLEFQEGLREARSVEEKGTQQEQPPPTPNCHEDSKEHSASVIKQMGHLENKQKNTKPGAHMRRPLIHTSSRHRATAALLYTRFLNLKAIFICFYVFLWLFNC